MTDEMRECPACNGQGITATNKYGCTMCGGGGSVGQPDFRCGTGQVPRGQVDDWMDDVCKPPSNEDK